MGWYRQDIADVTKLSLSDTTLYAARREHTSNHPVLPAFVIDHVTRPKFRQGQESRPVYYMQIASGWHQRSNWKAREVVARQKSFTGKIAVGIEISLGCCADALLCDVKTSKVQQWLNQIADDDGIGPNSLKHNKHFLSGVFKFAKKQNHVPRHFVNPARDADVPEAIEGDEPYAYSLEEVRTMLALIPEPARTAVAVAAMTGIKASEIRGLEWPDYTPESATIQIRRSVWRKFTSLPKTKKSRAPIPVIPLLAKILETHRLREGNPTSGPIFRNGRGKPLCVDSLGMRVIGQVKGIEWHGWHAFRRGLASNLNRLGVDDSVMQAILRHSSVTVTQAHYIKTNQPDAVLAMQQFENALGISLTCATVRQDKGEVVVN
jgi:integrase